MEAADSEAKRKGKIGVLSIYRQDWAITRFVDRIRQHFSPEELIVLSEDVSSASLLEGGDDQGVVRCWRRSSGDYVPLMETIARENVRVLLVNCCFPFFDRSEFSLAMTKLAARNVRIVAHIQDLSAVGPMQEFLRKHADAVVVDSGSAKLQVIAAGIARSKVHVIKSATGTPAGGGRAAARKALGITDQQRVIAAFDFGVPEEEAADPITALYRLDLGVLPAHLYMLQVDIGTGFDGGYGASLKKKTEDLHLDGFVHFVQNRGSSAPLGKHIAAADVVVVSGSGPQFETREVLGAALETGSAIIALSALPLDDLSGVVFSASKRLPLSQLLSTVLARPDLREALCEASGQWATANSSAAAGEAYAELFERLSGIVFSADAASGTGPGHGADAPVAAAAGTPPQPFSVVRRTLRVLMQNRSNALTHRGGDTVVMEKLALELQALGHTVDVDVECRKNPREYDLVHLYNFAIREATEKMAMNAHASQVPYVVTTLYEDWPKFFNQMANLFYVLNAYVDAGQPRAKWAELLLAARQVKPAPAWDNTWAAHHSHALLASGAYEADALRRDYPQSPRIEVVRFGCEVADADDGTLFRNETGLSDFILCVGRLEWRKNQLMLLKALEDSDLTVVFAAGGFTYQPEYEAACRKVRRRGKTIFLGRLEPRLLASAFAAARVHALPSWFELPGLVSLEAARYGANVVATTYGTAADYLGEYAYYCAPDDDQSILNAVTAAYYAPRAAAFAEHVRQFTWRSCAESTVEVYHKVLGEKAETRSAPEDARPAEVRPAEVRPAEVRPVEVRPAQESLDAARQTSDHYLRTIEEAREQTVDASYSVSRIPEVVGPEAAAPADEQRATALSDEGDVLLRDGMLAEAREKYQHALEAAPGFSRAHRSLGVAALKAGDVDGAEREFRAALRSDPRDAKALVGLGAVEWERGKKHEAFDLYQRAAEREIGGTSALLHLINAGYELNRVQELERLLRKLVRENRENLNIQYCLAGCYFRQGKDALASAVIEHILQVRPDHPQALELKQEVEARIYGSPRAELVTDSPDSTNGPLPTQQERTAFTPLAAPQPAAGTPGASAPTASTTAGQSPAQGTLSALGLNGHSAARPQAPVRESQASEVAPHAAAALQLLQERKRRKEYQEVIAGADELLRSSDAGSSQRALARILKGEALACIGRNSDALLEFESAEADLSYGFRALIGSGALAAARGDWSRGKECFERALSANSKSDAALAGLGICAVGEGKLEDGWKLHCRALAMNPENMQSLHGLIQLAYHLERLPELETMLNAYLDLNPVDLSMTYALAGCLFGQGKHADAKEQCRKILLFEPEHALAAELLERIDAPQRSYGSAG